MHVEILNENIEMAERILLPSGCHFDAERRIFIKNLSTLDLQAVPGSGKTTALLAKLVALASKMPLQEGAGVLVISHTNAAIDEIKEKIGNIVPILFQYPNYVGTIQSFVDQFLAIPYYSQKYGHNPNRIDDETYTELCYRYLNGNNSGSYWLANKRDPLSILNSINAIDENDVIEIPGLKKTTSPAYKSICDFRFKWVKKGFLRFEDAFIFAEKYLKECPQIGSLLKNRFKFVFVDEMQDMSKRQCELLEKIFFDTSGINHFQRIGDRNQSIYSGSAEGSNDSWKNREIVLNLNGSQRLCKNIADVVQPFSITDQPIEGRMKKSNGDEIEIKPYLITYSEDKIDQVIPKYISIISELKRNSSIDNVKKEKYAVIGWRKTTGNGVCIDSFYPAFKNKSIEKRKNYKSLKAYLFNCDKSSNNMDDLRSSILNALLKILRIEDIKDSNNLFFTKKSLLEYLKRNESAYSIFKSYLYNWCKKCANELYAEVLSDIRCYLPSFLQIWSKTVSSSKNFVYDDSMEDVVTQESSAANNDVCIDGISVSIQTVHSIKGQTCTGILYLDTYNGNGCGSSPFKYESEKLSQYFLGQKLCDNPNEKKFIKEAAKIVYVGFSRPTHLLCYAVQKEKFDKYLSNIDKTKWNVVNV